MGDIFSDDSTKPCQCSVVVVCIQMPFPVGNIPVSVRQPIQLCLYLLRPKLIDHLPKIPNA